MIDPPKFPVTRATMEKLFAPNGFFSGCNREDILSEESTWYITMSDDGKFLLLVQVVDTKEEILASLRWDNKVCTNRTNPWLRRKKTVENRTMDEVSEESPCLRGFKSLGKHEGWNSSMGDSVS